MTENNEESDYQVKHLRLVNGDELIVELSGSTDNTVLVKKPMLVSEVTDSKTKLSTIVLSKYIMFDDTDISLSKNHIVTQSNVLDEIRSYYYNSIEYNKLFLEPAIKNELAKVNHIMKNMIRMKSFPGRVEENFKEKIEKIIETESNDDEDDDGGKFEIRIMAPSSNTYH